MGIIGTHENTGLPSTEKGKEHKGNRIEIIQLIRGIAALLVCFLHMKGAIKNSELAAILFGNGSIGVPLFFIISGFIMYTTTRNAEPKLRFILSFWGKRILRIAPFYFLCTLLYLAIYSKLSLFLLEHPRWLLPTLLFYPTYGSYTGPAYGFPPLEVGWSLNYEIYFYLLIGLFVFAGRWRWICLSGFLAICVLVLPYFTNGYVMQTLRQWYAYPIAYFSLVTNPVLLFFISGIGLGKLYFTSFRLNSILVARILVVMSSSNLVLTYLNCMPLFHAYWHHLVNCTLFLFALLMRDKIEPYNLPRFVVYLGNISFSIYLMHPLVIGAMPKLFRKLQLPMQTEGWEYFFLLLIAVLIAASVTYIFIEKPLNRLSDKLIEHPKKTKANQANP
jgi:exopolysaccharide production protein ExoZ